MVEKNNNQIGRGERVSAIQVAAHRLSGFLIEL
jgi:hypothetical protein